MVLLKTSRTVLISDKTFISSPKNLQQCYDVFVILLYTSVFSDLQDC